MSHQAMIELSGERAGFSVCFQGIKVGSDLVTIVSGGDKAHIGATALAQPRPSLKNSEKISASTSVLCVMGHKEDMLAHHLAQTLASHLNCVVSVSCGIHMDNADAQQIKSIQSLVTELLDQFILKLKQH